MSERQQGPYDAIAHRWLELIERRHANFIDLYDTGRWRHYFTQEQFLDEIRKVLRLRDQWSAIAGVTPDGEALVADSAMAMPQRASTSPRRLSVAT
jgi:uncharacterized repeat protein (TIGR03809 family)